MKFLFQMFLVSVLSGTFPLSADSLAIPGYAGAAIYTAAEPGEEGCLLEYREAGTANWNKGVDLVLSHDKREFRGSILNLTENKHYEYRLLRKRKTENGSFFTKSVHVPIAKTIELSNENFKGHLNITESGTAEGYIRYSMRKGEVLRGDKAYREAILLKNVKYVILEGLVIRGGGHHCIQLVNCENIQIRNCDLGEWGSTRQPYNLAPGSEKREVYKRLQFDGKRYVNNQSGIEIRGGGKILVERNFLHDPCSTANPWFYTHPWGPSGIHYGMVRELTIRWNDIIGGDYHRWNDALEGIGNGKTDGGPYRDSEIYGNYLAFGNDDAVELDGGQMNVRFFHNRMEGFFCGVSTAPCISGPSYVVQNLFMKPGDEFGKCGSAIKFGGFKWYPGRIFILGNTLIGNKAASYTERIMSLSSYFNSEKATSEQKAVLKSVVENNVFHNCRPAHSRFSVLKNFVDCNFYTGDKVHSYPGTDYEHHGKCGDAGFVNEEAGDYRTAKPISGKIIPGITDTMGIPSMMPVRPFPVTVSRYTVELNSEHATEKVMLKSEGFTGKFFIVQPGTSGFFSVQPGSGELHAGETLSLTVRALPEKAEEARIHNGAFLVRNEAGFSLPISVYFDNRDDTAKISRKRQNAIFGRVVKISSEQINLEFDSVPKGRYYLFIRTPVYNYHVKLQLSDKEPFLSVLYPGARPAVTGGWANLPWNFRAKVGVNLPHTLSGKFTIQIHSAGARPILIDACALAKSPEEFLHAGGHL